jgi:hypothetical protein
MQKVKAYEGEKVAAKKHGKSIRINGADLKLHAGLSNNSTTTC